MKNFDDTIGNRTRDLLTYQLCYHVPRSSLGISCYILHGSGLKEEGVRLWSGIFWLRFGSYRAVVGYCQHIFRKSWEIT
jgi:hypothetical protein